MTEQRPVPNTSGQDDWEFSDRWAKIVGRDDRVVELRDPRAMRAIAHQARQQVIEILFSNSAKSCTATALAEQTGLSPSAMSYHLRALEKWGVIERAGGDADGRNRPWRSAGTRLHVSGGTDRSTAAAQLALTELSLDQLRQRLQAFLRWPRGRRRSFRGIGEGEFWLTEAEAARFVSAIERAEIELLESGVKNEPGPGKLRIRFLWSLLPNQDQTFPTETS